EVWYTLPVLPTGLTPDGEYVLQSALAAGVDIAGVNVMAMDYGDAAAPNPEGQMGRYAIQAGESLKTQLEGLYRDAGIPRSEAELYRMVGVTPMIGQNDVNTERFYQEDARQLLAWAEQKDIGMLSMWSATRDMAGAGLSPTHSGVPQSPGEFHEIFSPFTGDSVPSVRVSDASAIEGDEGVAGLEFSVTLSQPHDALVTVDFATSEGSATAEDFVPTAGTLAFAPGETVKNVVVQIVGDSAPESDEELSLQLSNATQANLRDAAGVGKIVDDDLPPVVTINDVEVVEASTDAVFLVSLSRPPKSGETFAVDYRTRDVTANRDDYVAVEGRLEFNAGETQKELRIRVLGETVREADETFEVAIGSVNAIVGDDVGVGTIVDDDTPQVEVGYFVQSDWGSGFTASMRIGNTSEEPISDWRLEFNFAGEITSIWSAVILERRGDSYVVGPADWTRDIAPGAGISFGFQAVGDGSTEPTDTTLDGNVVVMALS
ncbi:MAG: Calx-beta domain-containing protein, partial [Planctomycetota bacterium]